MKRTNVYWSEKHEEALQEAYKAILEDGWTIERNGEPNRSAIILYALQQLPRKIKGKKKNQTLDT